MDRIAQRRRNGSEMGLQLRITTLRTVSRRQTAADKPRSLTRVSASTKRRGAVIPFAQQAQSGARGAQI
ncbi:hypothetical protein E4U36_008330 [Claviceps purpurea]|nr:hypothetical protein E4U36_008330 [Claviceps purpurea]